MLFFSNSHWTLRTIMSDDDWGDWTPAGRRGPSSASVAVPQKIILVSHETVEAKKQKHPQPEEVASPRKHQKFTSNQSEELGEVASPQNTMMYGRCHGLNCNRVTLSAAGVVF